MEAFLDGKTHGRVHGLCSCCNAGVNCICRFALSCKRSKKSPRRSPRRSTAKLPVSVIVAARNEEKNLPRCLEALRDVGEVYVIDSESTDATPEIARVVWRQRWCSFTIRAAGRRSVNGR